MEEPEERWWRDFSPSCATEAATTLPQTLATNSALPAVDEPAIEWVVQGFCESNQYGGHDLIVDDNVAAYQMTTGRHRIAMVVDASPFFGAAGVAILGPGGDELRCLTDEDNDLGFATPPLRALGDLRSWVTANTPGIGEEDPPEGATIRIGQRRLNTRHEGCARIWDSPAKGRWTEHAVTGNGQHLAVHDRERIFSVDAKDCSPLWTASGEELLRDPGGPVRIHTLFTPTPTHVFVLLRNDAKMRLVQLGPCGQPMSTTGELTSGVGSVFRVGDGWLVWHRDGTGGEVTGHGSFYSGTELTGDPQRLEMDCAYPAQVSDDEFACLFHRREGGQSIVEIRQFKVPSGETTRTVRVVETDTPGMGLLSDPRFVVALQGAVLIAVSDPSETTDEGRTPVSLLFLEEDDDVHRVVLDRATPRITNGFSPATPIALPTGQVLVAAHGHLYSVRTPYPGLAPTAYPRGQLGGNDNLGYARVADP